MELKTLLALIGIILSLTAPLPYIRDIIRHQTKPHIITWLIWSVLAMAGFLLQLEGGGGLGSWVLGATAVMNVIIFSLCLRRPKDHVTSFDLVVLALAFVAIGAWLTVDNSELAICLVTAATILGTLPTIKKTVKSPQHETASLFFISGLKQLVGIVSLSAYNLLTLLFPVTLVILNFLLVFLILGRPQPNHKTDTIIPGV